MIRLITPDGKYMDSELTEYSDESTKLTSWAVEFLEMVE
jgi:hypothetical protein